MPFLKNVLKLSILPIESVFIIEFDVKLKVKNPQSSLRCLKYKTHKDRLFQVRKLNLCEFCLSSKHVTCDCVGLKTGLPFKCLGCGSSKHVSPICTSPSVSMSVEKKKTRGFDSGKMRLSLKNTSEVASPIIKVPVQTPSGEICLKFLVDTGSQILLINYKRIKSTLLNLEPCCNNLKA